MTKKKKNETQPQEIKVRDAVFHPEFREDLAYWVKTNRKTALRAFDLIEAIMRDPFIGIVDTPHTFWREDSCFIRPL